MALTEKLSAIGDAIREKTGTVDLIPLEDMPEFIDNIQTGGGITPTGTIRITSNGNYDVVDYANADVNIDVVEPTGQIELKTNGIHYVKNFEEALVNVEIPKPTGTLNITENGNYDVTDYANANVVVNSGDEGQEYFIPPPLDDYTIIRIIKKTPLIDVSNMTSLKKFFYDCRALEEVSLTDTSKITSFESAFGNCYELKTIPQLNTSRVGSFASAFSGCQKLESLPLLDCSKVGHVGSMFSSCKKLTNLGGFKNLGLGYSANISANSSTLTLNLSSCTNLTHESLMNVINNLYDIGSRGINQQSLSLGTTNLAKLTEEEIAIATNKGWNVK